MRRDEAVFSEIANDLGIPLSTAGMWCADVVMRDGIKKLSRRKAAAKTRYSKNKKKQLASSLYAKGINFSEIATA